MATKRGGKSGQRTPSGSRSGDGDSPSASDAGQVTRWWLRLSGRKRWLALFGLIGAVIGAAAGWWGVGQVEYRASAAVQLGLTHGLSPSAIPGVGGNEALRMDEVVQRELAELRRLAGAAGQAEGLVIEARRAEDSATRLDVTATAQSAEAAVELLRTVLEAYRAATALDADAIRAAAWSDAIAQLNVARAEAAAGRAQLAQTRAAMREDRDDSASAYAGPITEVDPAWSAAIWTQNETRRAAAMVRERLAELESLPIPPAEQVASLDPEAATWWGRMQGLNALLADAVWPPNPTMAQHLSERAALEAQLQARAADTRILPLGDAGLTFRAVRISETQAQLAELTLAQSLAEQRVAELEPRLTAWRELNARVQDLEAQLAMQEAAAAELDPGSGVRLLHAELVSPDAAVWRDQRPASAWWGAGLGGVAGMLIGGGVFVFDKRVRRSRDGGLIGSRVPVLGAVPTTGDNLAKPAPPGDQRIEVASIQAVRAVLESKLRPAAADQPPGGAFAVTGISAGSGATSVAVGLAVSMALSGSRVLLVDLAWLQKPAGSGSDDDATRAGLGVDGVIEDLGYLDDEDREAIALADEGDESDAGFGAILRGVSLRRSVVQTRVDGLSVLSAMGRAEALRAEWAGRVSSRWLSKLMEVARRGGYTATILDAGSATGSVEGMLGCAAADGTVLVVSGGQTQADYDKAVTRLRLVGATILGTVLNRSDAKRLGTKQAARSAARLQAAGGTTGSGIFAAAIEAGTGSGLVNAGSKWATAPLPRVEDDSNTTAATEAQAQAEADVPAEAASVDPFPEPPTTVQPTPLRQPPAQSDAASEPLPQTAEASSVDPAEDADTEPSPDIHIADDVMDQFVDHAIRAAQRPRSAPPHPPTRADTD